MHDCSLPTSDRLEPPEAAPGNERPAFALAVPGGYYRGLSFNGKPWTTFGIGRAKVFLTEVAVNAEIAKLKRLGISATVVNVVLKIGG